MTEPVLPDFIAKISGLPIRSKTDEGAVMELMDAFGMLPSPNAGTRDYDAETAPMRAAASHGRERDDA